MHFYGYQVLLPNCQVIRAALLCHSLRFLLYRMNVTQNRLYVILKWTDKKTILCQMVFHLSDSIFATVKL